MSELNVISKVENPLLERVEVNAVVKVGASNLSRKLASQMLAKEFGVDEGLVIPISIKTFCGRRDAIVHAYVYKDLRNARTQLPKHYFTRLLSREEREKLKKESASKKAEKKQAAARGGK
jgi:ribosomal protein S24E